MDRYPVKEGVKAGAIAFLGGLLLSVLLSMMALSSGEEGGLVLISIIVYFGAHLWPLIFGDVTAVLLVASIVPILLLVVSGYRLSAKAENGQSGFVNGATVTAGYGLLALLSVVYFVSSDVGGLMAALLPDDLLLVAFVFTGLLMPIAFGGLGGMLAD